MKAEDIKLAIEHGDMNVVSERIASIIREGNEELKKRIELIHTFNSIIITHNALEAARSQSIDNFTPHYFNIDERGILDVKT